MEHKMSLIESIEFGNSYIAQYYFEHNKDSIIFTDTFHVWNGDIWKSYDDNSMTFIISNYLTNEINKIQQLGVPDKAKKIRTVGSKHLITFIKDLVKAQSKEHTLKMRLLNILDSSRDSINYRNGLLCLRTGIFRKREKSDYISRCLDYDYESNLAKYNKEIAHINTIFKQVCNNSDKLYNFKKECMGYFLTGETKENKFFIETGLGGNGKSLMIEAFETVFDIYVKKLSNKTFCANYNNAHKQIIGTIHKRLTYIEEICVDKLSNESLKDFVNGSKIVCEKLFSTTIEFYSQSKLAVICNTPPEFQTDGGIARRGIVCEYKNSFVDDPKKVNESKHIYFANKDLKYLFDKDEYKNAMIAILLPYAMKYYNKGFVVPDEYKKLFSDLCDENDTVMNFINNNFIITNSESDRISKDELTKMYNQIMKTNNKFIYLLPHLKRIGIKYNKDGSVNGKRGVIIGIKFSDNQESDSESEETKQPIKVSKPKQTPKQIPIPETKFKAFNSHIDKCSVSMFGYGKSKDDKKDDKKDDEKDDENDDEKDDDFLADAQQAMKRAPERNDVNDSESESSFSMFE